LYGRFAFDAIETPIWPGTPSRRRRHAISLADEFFTRVNLVGVVGDDFTRQHEEVFREGSVARRVGEGKENFFWSGNITTI